MQKKYEMFRYKKGEFVFDRQKCVGCLRLGIPTTLQHCALSFGSVLVQRLVNSFGKYTMSAFMVGNRIQSYAFIPALSFNAGISMFVGQNIGAGKTERAIRGLRSTAVMSLVICLVISTLAYAFAVPLAALFGLTGEALGQAVEFIRFVAFLLTMMSVSLPMNGMLQGAGDVSYATLCTFSSLAVRVIAAYMMAGWFDMGYSSVWKCLPVGWAVTIAMTSIRILRGKWKFKSLVKPTGKQQPEEELTDE